MDKNKANAIIKTSVRTVTDSRVVMIHNPELSSGQRPGEYLILLAQHTTGVSFHTPYDANGANSTDLNILYKIYLFSK